MLYFESENELKFYNLEARLNKVALGHLRKLMHWLLGNKRYLVGAQHDVMYGINHITLGA